MSKRYQYYVEGECEKQLLKSFMYLEEDCFQEGKVEVFNFINEKMSNARARTIKTGTTIVVIVDPPCRTPDRSSDKSPPPPLPILGSIPRPARR